MCRCYGYSKRRKRELKKQKFIDPFIFNKDDPGKYKYINEIAMQGAHASYKAFVLHPKNKMPDCNPYISRAPRGKAYRKLLIREAIAASVRIENNLKWISRKLDRQHEIVDDDNFDLSHLDNLGEIEPSDYQEQTDDGCEGGACKI